MQFEVGFDASPSAREALAALGRSEDVRFAPGGRRLAIAGFAANAIAIADVEIARSAEGPEIAVRSIDLLPSAALREPHGLDFLDDDTVVVGNRSGGISVFRVPASVGAGEVTQVEPVGGGEAGLLEAPGSVAVDARGPGRYEVLACNNEGHTVTRHKLDASGALVDGEVVARRWLSLPDGLALSHDRRWLAVSNHDGHCVFVYDQAELGEDAEPVGILRGVHYPHGVRFAGGDSYVIVADAGAPHVHVFLPPGDGWDGVAYPAATITVMDDETFLRGRHNRQEGGPKGIDVDPRTNVLAMTSECQPLAFFDLGAALEGRGRADMLVRCELDMLDEKEAFKAALISEASAVREELKAAWVAHALERTEKERLAGEVERLVAEVERVNAEYEQLGAALAESNALLDGVHNSTSWRVTAPLRRAIEVARRLKQRGR